MEPKTERIKGVEIFRVLASFIIVTHHVKIFTPNTETAPEIYPYLGLTFAVVARFMALAFLILAGYFWGKKVRSGASPIAYSISSIRKLMTLFFWWSIIYLLPYNFGSIPVYGLRGPLLEMGYRYQQSTRSLMDLIFSGTQGQLWFLMALACAMTITAFCVRHGLFKTLAVSAILFYIFGMLGETYLHTPLGTQINFNVRHGPFLSTLCFASGYYISGLKNNPGWLKLGAVILIFACVLQVAELVLLFSVVGPSLKLGYFFATFFGALGFTLMSLSDHRFLQNEWLAGLGKYTLGIYLSHFIVVENLKLLARLSDSLLWEISSALFIYALCLGFAVLLSKNKLTRKLVT